MPLALSPCHRAAPPPKRHPQSRKEQVGRSLGNLVADALIVEVRATPKPGLVDLRNTGSHRDRDVSTFLASTTALRPLLGKFFATGASTAHLHSCELHEELRPIGRECEQAMFGATNGVNTHKGAILAFGLLLGHP